MTPVNRQAVLLIHVALPIVLFLLFFFFYNFGKISPSEMIKTTGLLSISLLGITLIIGPLSRIIPGLDTLKIHRKFWGILSFVIALIHTLLVYVYFFKWNFFRFIDTSSVRFPGILFGLLGLAILLMVTLISNNKAITLFGSKTWKVLQMTSYIALLLAITHFYLMESTNGVLVIKRSLGKVAFGFAIVTIIARVTIFLLPSNKKIQERRVR